MVEERSLTIIQLNDSHGYFEVHSELFWVGSREVYKGTGGYSRISTLFNRISEECGGTIMACVRGDHRLLQGGDPRGKENTGALRRALCDAVSHVKGVRR
jgi:2',3'-cyclic-nucleotide 2'-phosphodiesterase (5'-nucleotidase family)